MHQTEEDLRTIAAAASVAAEKMRLLMDAAVVLDHIASVTTELADKIRAATEPPQQLGAVDPVGELAKRDPAPRWTAWVCSICGQLYGREHLRKPVARTAQVD